jgi:hypothetical protein
VKLYDHKIHCSSCQEIVQVQSVIRNILYVRPKPPWQLICTNIRAKNHTLVKTIYKYLCPNCVNIKDIIQ